MPEDETCFFLYEAPRLEDVREAARRARLPFERVIACFAVLVAVLVLAGCGADGPASKASAASARPVSPASGS